MSDDLDRCLLKIDQVLNIEELLQETIGVQEVIDSYQQDDSIFQSFYSLAGSLHVSLSEDNRFHQSGYYSQARMIQKAIEEAKAERVLELCCGKGFNLIYLAKQNPRVQFEGVDLMPAHIQIAQRRSGSLNNISYRVGNIEELEYPSGIFDIVFAVESLFHVTDLHKAMSEALRLLKPGGRMINFDFCRTKELDELKPNQRNAIRLADHSFVFSSSVSVNAFVELAQEVWFRVLAVDDLTCGALPDIMHLNKYVKLIFAIPALTKKVMRVFSLRMIDGVIGWELMPSLIEENLMGYYRIELTIPTGKAIYLCAFKR